MPVDCSHTDSIARTAPGSQGCEDCERIGGRWVHLRRCDACGHVGCCDSSANKHATAHFHDSGHPLVQSYEPGEEWFWCYVDEVGFETGGPPSPSHT